MIFEQAEAVDRKDDRDDEQDHCALAAVLAVVSFGGTAPSQVRRQIRYWKKRLARA